MRDVARAAFAVFFFALAAPAHAQDAPPPVEAFGHLPVVEAAAISPDGTKVALGMSQGEDAFINVVDLAQRRPVYTGAVDSNTDLRDVGWADDTHVSLVMSRTFLPGAVLPVGVRFEGAPSRVIYFRTALLNLVTRNLKVLSTGSEDNVWADQGSVLIAPLEGSPGEGRMIGRAPGADNLQPAVFRVNLDSGRTLSLSSPGANTNTIEYWLDVHGAVGARVDSDPRTNHWQLFLYDTPRPHLLLEDTSATGLPISIQGFFPDGRLAVLNEGENGLFGLYAISSTDRRLEEVFRAPHGEIDSAIQDPWTRQVVGVSWTEQESTQHFFDSALQAAYDRIVARFAEGGAARIVNWSRDRQHFLVYAEQGMDGGGYYVFDVAHRDALSRTRQQPIGRAPGDPVSRARRHGHSGVSDAP